jgi:hypothetical protein
VDPVEHVADAPFTALALTEVWGGYAEAAAELHDGSVPFPPPLL